jgi:MFS family permease
MAFLALALRTTPDSVSDEPQGNPVQKVIEGFRFIRAHPTMAFLIGMVFFNSFFGIAYIYMMPVFAVDVLDVGANGQGLLLGASGVGSLTTTLWFTTRKQVRRAGLVIGFGAVLTGAALAAFALTAEYVGSMVLALVLMYALGAFNSSYIMVTTTALQMAVPDELRGRVMGFFGMTWQIAPLGGMWAGFLATVIGAPWAVAVGGFGLMAFALGPALMNVNFRRLSLTDGGASLVAESAR